MQRSDVPGDWPQWASNPVIRKIGLIVNPVAGMGGSVGLKGTDGDMHARALELGAHPISPARTSEFLEHIRATDQIEFLAAPGAMGTDHVAAAGLCFESIGSVADQSTQNDTKVIARLMRDNGAELIVFAGGDGTARDVSDAIGADLPVVAIPSGVKVYSSVFAFSPRSAAELLDAYLDGAELGEEEVLDIDEEAFRKGRVDSRHYGYLLVPENKRLLQGGKESSNTGSLTDEAKEELAGSIIDEMQPGTLYLLGSGTTIRTITDSLGIDKTLLGIDAVVDRKLVASDLNEHAILELLDTYAQAAIVVTPLGGNGFIFGRGNKQFTPAVLRRVGLQNITIFANRDKLLKLTSLHVDTGDNTLDEELRGYVEVVVGRAHRKLMRVL